VVGIDVDGIGVGASQCCAFFWGFWFAKDQYSDNAVVLSNSPFVEMITEYLLCNL